MLIKCNECGKEISDKASACIHCGCPIEKNIQLSNDGCPLCKNNNHINKDGRDTCAICGYVFNADEYKKGNPDCNYSLDTSSNVPHCPFCNSTNIQKIGTIERTASVIGLGLISKKINKSFKCNNCGGTF